MNVSYEARLVLCPVLIVEFPALVSLRFTAVLQKQHPLTALRKDVCSRPFSSDPRTAHTTSRDPALITLVPAEGTHAT